MIILYRPTIDDLVVVFYLFFCSSSCSSGSFDCTMSEAEFYQKLDKRDVYQHLLVKERMLTPYHRRSTQLEHRNRLLSFILRATRVYNLHMTTKHLSLQFLDRFLDSCVIQNEDQLMLLAIACLGIAGKCTSVLSVRMYRSVE